MSDDRTPVRALVGRWSGKTAFYKAVREAKERGAALQAKTADAERVDPTGIECWNDECWNDE